MALMLLPHFLEAEFSIFSGKAGIPGLASTVARGDLARKQAEDALTPMEVKDTWKGGHLQKRLWLMW